ncbi:hypothetical protein Sango_1550900 [Sesamum angolense]|uniref:Uncharacterized protein n=1 Tax=Sesamum angolense TaxID=2727404 RepID=A0AAE2BTL7_9LAMI|nr:hypothetical protein Sango_1550900 [Sesamum angolense]
MRRRIPVCTWVMRRRGWFSMPPGQLYDLLIKTKMVRLMMPLWNGCTQSQLVSVAELVNIKAESHISKQIYDRISQWTDHILSHDHTLPLDYYSTKKLMKDLDLLIRKIDAYKNGCMLYWNDDIIWTTASFVKNLDGFAPHSPSNPKHFIDIYLDSLIKELQDLWHVGVLTRDNAENETFTIHAAFMWTLDDLPTYKMAFGWSSIDATGCRVLERKVARPRLTGEQIRDWVENFSPAVEELRLHDMKSNDCHVFMQKLILIAFCKMLPELVEPRRNDDLCMNNTCIQWSIFNYSGRASGGSKKREDGFRWITSHNCLDIKARLRIGCLSLLVLLHPPDCKLGIMQLSTNPSQLHPSTEIFVGAFNLFDDTFRQDDPNIKELVATQFKKYKNRFKRCIEVAFQEEETIPTLQVVTDNHLYDLHDPNGIQLVVELFLANQQGTGTSRSANCESNDKSDEDRFDEDYETE